MLNLSIRRFLADTRIGLRVHCERNQRRRGNALSAGGHGHRGAIRSSRLIAPWLREGVTTEIIGKSSCALPTLRQSPPPALLQLTSSFRFDCFWVLGHHARGTTVDRGTQQTGLTRTRDIMRSVHNPITNWQNTKIRQQLIEIGSLV
jgi:hypothetical protein